MDFSIVGLFVIAAIVAGAAYFLRPPKVLPLHELLARLTSINADPQLTAAQKIHLCEIAYNGFEANLVSILGTVQDVFPNAAVVIRTAAPELPLIGIELARVSAEELRAFSKGKTVTLRARLPAWKAFTEIVGLPASFREPKLFYGGVWHGVKSTYRVRDPSEPRTGTFQAVPPRTGQFPAMAPKTGQFPALPTKTGQFPAASPKTGQYPVVNMDDPPKRNQ